VIYYILRALSDRMNIVSVDTLNRVGVVVSCVAIAYVLGANNVGLNEGAAELDSGQTFGLAPILVVTTSAILGMLVFGKGSVSATVGDRLMSLSPSGVFSTFIGSSISVWAGTLFGLPISITQCLLGGMFGAAFTKKVHVLNDRLALEEVDGGIPHP
jgi:PiT family inorganic phosphate transporter